MKTRYAPTPSGSMHLGHARTALVTWLLARKRQGRIVMRIEDLDPPRVRPGSVDDILRGHEWLGLDWDEGPIFQSTRSERYREIFETLRGEGRLYPCTCTRKELQEAASRAPHGPEAIYSGRCRIYGSQSQRSAAWRFHLTEVHPYVDLIAGAQNGEGVGDMIVRRSDQLFAYPLAVVIDDHDEEISCVVRGADLLAATSQQIAIYKALNWPVPQFAHVPLLLGSDGVRLAKRNGATPIAEYREQGLEKQSVLGKLAHSLGLVASDEPKELEELLALFQLSQLRFDEPDAK